MRHLTFVALAAAMLLTRAAFSADMSDADFIKDTYQNNLKEHAMAGLAEAKATDNKVKEFASMLSKDHLKANEDLKAMGKKMNIQMPDFKDEKEAYTKLSNMNGQQFDLAFLNWTMDSHQKEIARFEAQQKIAKGDLKNFIDAQMPHIKGHLDQARKLNDMLSKGAMRSTPVSEQPINTSYNPMEVFNDETVTPTPPQKDSGAPAELPTAKDPSGKSSEFGPMPHREPLELWK